MNVEQKQNLASYLGGFLTDHRRELINTVLAQRTRHISVLLENIYQPHNASAVLRSCDCFGVQDVHIVEDTYEYRVNPDIALGAWKWLSLHRHCEPDVNNTEHSLHQLRQQGYKVLATTLRPESVSLLDVDISQKMVLCFGTEENGLSELSHDMADQFVTIPMHGFTQSYNISVSAALCLFELTKRLRASDVDWQLPADEQLDLLIDWQVNSTKKGNALVRHFCRQNGLEIEERWFDEEEEDEELQE